MSIQLPKEIAMQKQMQAMQNNQLYTMAFQAYVQLLAHTNKEDALLARDCIRAAEVFIEAVKHHTELKRG